MEGACTLNAQTREFCDLHSNLVPAASNLTWSQQPPAPQVQSPSELVLSAGEAGLALTAAWPLQESFPSEALCPGGERHVAQPCLHAAQARG